MIDATTIIDYRYEDFLEGIDYIAEKIVASEFKPDYIVGIVRGGATPSVYLSHKLKIRLEMVHWSARDSDTREHNCWIPEDINNGKRILVVDDIVDGGDTIRELLDDWKLSNGGKLNLDNIRIAAMYYNTSQPVKVDFYHREIDRNEDSRWVIFPWEC